MKSFFLALLTISLVSVIPMNLLASEIDKARRIEVVGTSEMQRPADRVKLVVSVVSEDASSEQALRDNNKAIKNVTEALLKAGLADKEIETGSFHLLPVYSRSSADVPQIVRYRATNSLVVKTQKLEMAGQIISAAAKAGANNISNITFDIADPRQYRDEVLQQALSNARVDAESVAKSANIRAGQPLLISIEDTEFFAVSEMAFQRSAMSSDVSTTPLRPGDVTIRARVRVNYEIQ
jgi:uncharacterized protein YggE